MARCHAGIDSLPGEMMGHSWGGVLLFFFFGVTIRQHVVVVFCQYVFLHCTCSRGFPPGSISSTETVGSDGRVDAIGPDRVEDACHAKDAGTPGMRVRLIGPSKSSKSLVCFGVHQYLHPLHNFSTNAANSTLLLKC